MKGRVRTFSEARLKQREQRQHPRKALHPRVSVRTPQGDVVARCADISLGGAFIETEAEVTFGSQVDLVFEFPVVQGDCVITGVVRWTKPGGFGVQFATMGARETHGLVALLSAAAISSPPRSA